MKMFSTQNKNVFFKNCSLKRDFGVPKTVLGIAVKTPFWNLYFKVIGYIYFLKLCTLHLLGPLTQNKIYPKQLIVRDFFSFRFCLY